MPKGLHYTFLHQFYIANVPTSLLFDPMSPCLEEFQPFPFGDLAVFYCVDLIVPLSYFPDPMEDLEVRLIDYHNNINFSSVSGRCGSEVN